MKKRVAERTALAKTERIADEMHVAREKAWADAEYYRQEKVASFFICLQIYQLALAFLPVAAARVS